MGDPVEGSVEGGVYTDSFAPNTAYVIEVTSPAGTVTRTINITVNSPNIPITITSITTEPVAGQEFPDVTIEILALPDTTYDLEASFDLIADFVDFEDIVTDATGVGVITFSGVESREFYRVRSR